MTDCEYLRVVLLCTGRGAEKTSYRPRADESQWWGRRDALVRCVASFLFGANTNTRAGGTSTTTTRKELVLLFEEDLARVHMTLDTTGVVDNSRAFPKEETIVQLWKHAAQNLRNEVEYKGMRCSIHLDPTLSFVPPTSSSSTETPKRTNGGSTTAANSSRIDRIDTSRSIDRIDTKRAVLEYMHKHCSIAFLREQKINSHPGVVLRKTNRTALRKIWETWRKQRHASSVTTEGQGTQNEDEEHSHHSQRLKSIYQELLQFPQETTTVRSRPSSSSISTTNTHKIIAGTLHESSDEFPCFRVRPDEIIAGESQSYNICLFLGAVRDMTSQEQRLLEEVCEASKIPCVGVRLGTVPEFTSKILSVLVFHHSNRVLGIAMKRLLEKNSKTDEDRSRSMPIKQQPQSTCLNIICTVPKASNEISVRIEARDQTYWRLVRVIVCSLWRSKLVSTKSQIRHTNRLQLVFDDGVVVALNERDFVEKLARQHQAAPSEFQILTALVHEIERQSKVQAPPPRSKKTKPRNNKAIGDGGGEGWSRKKLAKRLVRSVVKSSPIPVTCTVGIEPNATTNNELVSRFYDHARNNGVATNEAIGVEADDPRDYGLLMVMDITTPSKLSTPFPQPELRWHEEDTPREAREIYRQLLSASRKQHIPTIQQTMMLSNSNSTTNGGCSVWDREAASIIALQHMCYQNRVFARRCYHLYKAVGSCQDRSGSKKRKKPS